jgi:hypothetical protein
MNENTLVERLRKRCDEETQRAVAQQLGVSQAYLSDVLAGRRKPGKKILDGLGVERRIVYQPTNGN